MGIVLILMHGNYHVMDSVGEMLAGRWETIEPHYKKVFDNVIIVQY